MSYTEGTEYSFEMIYNNNYEQHNDSPYFRTSLIYCLSKFNDKKYICQKFLGEVNENKFYFFKDVNGRWPFVLVHNNHESRPNVYYWPRQNTLIDWTDVNDNFDRSLMENYDKMAPQILPCYKIYVNISETSVYAKGARPRK